MPDLESVLSGLNEAQREAATALRGPVAILAGAGTGKTTTITHRIACQVRSGTFEPSQILAVTFTDKAAGELRTRLAALGVEGVEARTFHSAALSQLSRLWTAHTGEPLPQILDHKAPVISSLANALPPPHKFLPRRELAGEIEWAKNRMIPPERYLGELGDHEPPIPADLMHRVYDGYERRKASMGRLDFEDMLGLALRLFDEHPEAAEQVRSRFAAFTVDEYQDVNPLQAGLLERWLGDRDDLCVVGDDYQTIYAFTGASPSHLLGFTTRYPHATVVRLEENYRSTPEVLELANRLATRLGGFRKTLRATRPSGPPPLARAEPDEEAEVGAVVQAVRRLYQEEDVPLEEIAVLYRINARSEPFEEAFAAAAIPYQVRDGAFLRRPGPRSVLQRLKRAGGSVAEAVAAITDELGYDPEAAPDADEEVTRQSDLGRMRSLAAEFDRARPGGDAAAFGAELARAVLDRAQRPRREPAHVPPREGARVRRGVPAEAARRRAPVPLGPGEGRPRGGTPAPVRRDHARQAVPVPHLAVGRPRADEPVPGRDGARHVGALACEVGSRAGGHRGPGRRGVRPAEGVAPQASADRWRSRVRRVPRPHARRDRRTPVQGLGRPRRDLGGRAGQARALRGRGPGGRLGRLKGSFSPG